MEAEFRTDEEDVSEDADAVFVADELDGVEVADSRAAGEEAGSGPTQTHPITGATESKFQPDSISYADYLNYSLPHCAAK